MHRNSAATGAPGKYAAAAYDAVASFNRATRGEACAFPSEIAEHIAHLAAMTAALPQAFSQLSSALEAAQHRQVLTTDTLAEEPDPTLSVDLARMALDEARDHAVELYRLLDRAHNAAAHLRSESRRSTPTTVDRAAAPLTTPMTSTTPASESTPRAWAPSGPARVAPPDRDQLR